MFARLMRLVRPKRRTPNAQELDATAQAKQMRDDMETLRTGSLEGAPTFTHGGQESRRGS